MDAYDFRIIVIDDNPEIHKDFQKVLMKTQPSTDLENLHNQIFATDKKEQTKTISLPNFKIDTATQGEEGVKRIEEAIKEGKPYSLAFVDIRMPPGWDGVKTIQHIWKLDKEIQVVICTAYSDYTWEETIEQLGETDNLLILKKPFDHVAVRQLASALTRKWRLMQEVKQHTEDLENKIKERTELLQQQATHDAMTKLPNRTLLQEKVEQTIKASQINNRMFALLFFDLDRFKLINDSLSHAVGDDLLKLLSERLRDKIRSTDILARIGGDEFILLLENIPNKTFIEKFSTELLAIIKKPFQIADRSITVSSSIGISIYPVDGDNFDDLLRAADAAMYFAKRAGGNKYEFYTEEMNKENLRRLELENQLGHALENNELILHYQPQIDMKSKKIVAVEALVRWIHPEKGLMMPTEFIPIAEDTGLIIPLGEWVLREACKQNKKWQDEGLEPLRIAVNVTSHQLCQADFAKTVQQILDETGLNPNYLELELTENTIITNTDAIKIINELKALGVHIALDDFGTGYSSLNYLKELPLDRLKIDQSFVRNIEINNGDEVIIHAIINMARDLGLEVLAEGVENINQLDFLTENNCDEIQGFYFSKPLDAETIANLLKDTTKIKKLIEQEKTISK